MAALDLFISGPIYWANGIAHLAQADARDIPLPDESVHCVVTSPPYWGLRDYGIEGAIGMEQSLADWLSNMQLAADEIWRVLRSDGTLWLNVGDAYSGSRGGYGLGGPKQQRPRYTEGLPRPAYDQHRGRPPNTIAGAAPVGEKNMLGLPWRLAFQLQDAGWILRSDIIWHKPNPMPESVKDRPSSCYEHLFLFAKRPRYFFDGEAIKMPPSEGTRPRRLDGQFKPAKGSDMFDRRFGSWRYKGLTSRVNSRNVWTIGTQARPEAHFATFPDELARRCILAGSSAKGVCSECAAPVERIVKRSPLHGSPAVNAMRAWSRRSFWILSPDQERHAPWRRASAAALSGSI